MLLEIVKYPDKILRENSQAVDPDEIAQPEFQKLLEDMFETMYAAPGVGLAAVQIGVLKRVMVMDIGHEEGEVIERRPLVVINPEFTLREGSVVWEEGCLSCPDIVIPVKRFQKVTIRALDREGKNFDLSGEDLLAVAIQHEIDHMNGKLILDALSRLKRERYSQEVQKGRVAIR